MRWVCSWSDAIRAGIVRLQHVGTLVLFLLNSACRLTTNLVIDLGDHCGIAGDLLEDLLQILWLPRHLHRLWLRSVVKRFHLIATITADNRFLHFILHCGCVSGRFLRRHEFSTVRLVCCALIRNHIVAFSTIAHRGLGRVLIIAIGFRLQIALKNLCLGCLAEGRGHVVVVAPILIRFLNTASVR